MYLGVDVGTSGVKAVIIDELGALRQQATATLRVSRPRDLWSEQEAADWWSAAETAVLELAPELRRQVRGIGVAGQMHGATLLDKADQPLRPAILWNDGRSFAECKELEQANPASRAITGNLAMPGFTAPKLLWVRKHEPEVFDRIRTVLLPKDFVRLRMSGEKASDLSDSAGTLWLDVALRDWSEEMLAACGLTRGHMPALHEGNESTGSLRAEVADHWGMSRVPIAAGGGDNAAAAAGVGVVEDGDALLSLGTSGVIFTATERFNANPDRAVHAFCHCIPNMWHQMSVHLSAAACIDWAARLTGLRGPKEFFAEAELAGPAAGSELFLPYLSGERTPYNDPHLRGAFLGLGDETTRGRIAAAVLEGVAFALADGIAALREAGARVEELTVVGGGARSRYWGTILAAVLQSRLIYIDGGDVGPALGAARLAQSAVTGLEPSAICKRPPTIATLEPDAELTSRLAPKLARFRAAAAAAHV